MDNRKPIRVAAAQIEVRELDVQHNLDRIIYFIESAANQKAKTVCFCEGALTGWIIVDQANQSNPFHKLTALRNLAQDIDDAVEVVKKNCKANKINAIVGMSYPKSGKIENRALVIGKNGNEVYCHLKIKLTGHEQQYRAGLSFQTFPLENVQCGIAICYEFEDFDCTCVELKDKGARIIFNPKHHRSPPNTWKPNACAQVIRVTLCRAVENGVNVVSVNRAVEKNSNWDNYVKDPLNWQMSPSMIVNPHAIPLKMSYPTEEDLLVSDIYV